MEEQCINAVLGDIKSTNVSGAKFISLISQLSDVRLPISGSNSSRGVYSTISSWTWEEGMEEGVGQSQRNHSSPDHQASQGYRDSRGQRDGQGSQGNRASNTFPTFQLTGPY